MSLLSILDAARSFEVKDTNVLSPLCDGSSLMHAAVLAQNRVFRKIGPGRGFGSQNWTESSGKPPDMSVHRLDRHRTSVVSYVIKARTN